MATSVFVVEKNGATTEIEVNLEQMTGMDLKKEISALNGIPIKKMLLFYTSGLDIQLDDSLTLAESLVSDGDSLQLKFHFWR